MAGARAYRGRARASSSAFDALRQTIKNSDIAFNRLLSESSNITPPQFVDPKVNITTDSSTCSRDTPEPKIDKTTPSLIRKKFKKKKILQKKKIHKLKKKAELFLSHEKENSLNLKNYELNFDALCKSNSNTSQLLQNCNWSILNTDKKVSLNLSNISFDESISTKNCDKKSFNRLKISGNALPICSTPFKKSTFDNDDIASPIPKNITIQSSIGSNNSFEDLENEIKVSSPFIVDESKLVVPDKTDIQKCRLSPDLFHSSVESIVNIEEDDVKIIEKNNDSELHTYLLKNDSKLENSHCISDEVLELSKQNIPSIPNNSISMDSVETIDHSSERNDYLIQNDDSIAQSDVYPDQSYDLVEQNDDYLIQNDDSIAQSDIYPEQSYDLVEQNDDYSMQKNDSILQSNIYLEGDDVYKEQSNLLEQINISTEQNDDYLVQEDYSLQQNSIYLEENDDSDNENNSEYIPINDSRNVDVASNIVEEKNSFSSLETSKNSTLDSMEPNEMMKSISSIFINTRNRSNKYSIMKLSEKIEISKASATDLETSTANSRLSSESDSTIKMDSTDSSILSNSLSTLKSRLTEFNYVNINAEMQKSKRLTVNYPQRRSARLENFRLSKIKENELVTLPKVDDVRESCVRSQYRPSIILQPGKKWERSLSILKQANAFNFTSNTTVGDGFNQTINNSNLHRGRRCQKIIDEVLNLQNKDISCTINNTITSRRSVVRIVKEEDLDESNFDVTKIHEKTASSEIFSVDCDDTKVNFSRLSISEYNRSTALIDEIDPGDQLHWKDLSARDVVLRRCNQTFFLPFDDCYPERKLRNCQKIGEGVYGEVFLYKNELDPTKPIVMKVIPIEGTTLINGERQKKFNEILSEIVIAMELSDLRKNEYNKTSTFNKVNQVRCVKGRYPERLLELWDLYDEAKGSENDCPSVFTDDQLYVVLELANGGPDLESFTFLDARQSYSLFFQIIHALAVAEEAFQFEHRDLHWGNILVTPTYDENITFTHRGTEYRMPTNGVSATIIDFTLARMTVPQVACTIFNDLETDEDLFDANGDYQFEIYRLMRKKLCNNWQRFEPFTNILWMDYVLGKMIKGLRYDHGKSTLHTAYLNKLKKIKNKILNYNSCSDFISNEEF